ncbi:hypothetical protein [Dermatobacter hominis]|uniref:hypothetical protein n=1 Tax=Dermatobacter hominis TaxID=2884263 RepID=UPI001D0F53C0|nr:hypothetical protein [Dermatobacter hominis]UDY36288.1 hypothetical protein LH044_01845 [Dermatobacter hominis]
MAVVGLAAGLLAACAPPPDGGPVPYGCYHAIGNVNADDVLYGPKNTHDNAMYYSSRDGSCTGTITQHHTWVEGPVDWSIVGPLCAAAAGGTTGAQNLNYIYIFYGYGKDPYILWECY